MKQNTKRLSSMILALFFVVAAIVIYFDFLTPAYGDLQGTKGRLISEKLFLDNEKQIVSQVQTLISSYENEAQAQDLANAALPTSQSLAGAVAQVYGLAAADNMSVNSIGVTIQPPQVQPAQQVDPNAPATLAIKPYGTILLAVDMTGSYENFTAFIQGIETNIRLFDVSTLNIQQGTSAAKAGTLNNFHYAVTLQTYYQSN